MAEEYFDQLLEILVDAGADITTEDDRDSDDDGLAAALGAGLTIK